MSRAELNIFVVEKVLWIIQDVANIISIWREFFRHGPVEKYTKKYGRKWWKTNGMSSEWVDRFWINCSQSTSATPFIVLINGAFRREKPWELPRPPPARVPCTPAPTMHVGAPAMRGASSLTWRMSGLPGSSVRILRTIDPNEYSRDLK